MLLNKEKHRFLWITIIYMMVVTGIPILQDTGTACAATAEIQPQAVNVEVVNVPEQKLYLGLNEESLGEIIKLRVTFRDGSEKILPGQGYARIAGDWRRGIDAETEIVYENNVQPVGKGGKATIRYKEIYFEPEDESVWEGPDRTTHIQTLETKPFTIEWDTFQDYDPPLENNKNLESEVSEYGNQILFSNGELWKSPLGSVRYTKKSNIKGIVKEAYSNRYIDMQGILTCENLKGEISKNFKDVQDCGSGYVLQKDGTLIHYQPSSDDKNETKWKADMIIARGIEQCVAYSDGSRCDVIDKEGKAYHYEVDYDDTIEKIPMDTEKVVEICPDLAAWNTYYITETRELKHFEFWQELHRSKTVMNQKVSRFCGGFAIGTDGKTYALNGRKLLDTEMIDFKECRDATTYAADDKGNLYLCEYTEYPDVDTRYVGEWICDTLHLVATDFKEFSNYGYITINGKQKGLPDWDSKKEQAIEDDRLQYAQGFSLKADGTVYSRGQEVLTNVTSIKNILGSKTIVMGRKDGTVWLLGTPDFNYPEYEQRNPILTPQKLSQRLLNKVFNTANTKTNINELAFSYNREMPFTGKEVKPTVTIQDYDYTLKPGTDYDMTYKNNINEGTATITVVGKGDYTGTRNLPFTIKKAQNKPASSNKKNQLIQGTAKFTKIYGSKPFYLRAKTTGNGKLTYKSNNRSVIQMNQAGKATIKGPGRAIVTVTAAATANYNAATKQVLITVKPKKVTGLKVKAVKKKLTVSWKRDSKADGYQLTYAQDSKFKKGKKNITIRKNKTTKTVIKKVKPKKTYYVKARAYKKVGRSNLYGAYSKVRKVKIKQ